MAKSNLLLNTQGGARLLIDRDSTKDEVRVTLAFGDAGRPRSNYATLTIAESQTVGAFLYPGQTAAAKA